MLLLAPSFVPPPGFNPKFDSEYRYIPTEWVAIFFLSLFGLSTSKGSQKINLNNCTDALSDGSIAPLRGLRVWHVLPSVDSSIGRHWRDSGLGWEALV